MSSYAYEAVDAGGLKIQGTLEVLDQNEALRRIKEMGLFPTRVSEAKRPRRRSAVMLKASAKKNLLFGTVPGFDRRVGSAALVTFTRQLATLIEAGMPLLRGLRMLQEQAESPGLKRILGEISSSIEEGGSLSEALTLHPKVFNRLYVNMVKAGELGGSLEVALRRLAEFLEKAQKIKRKVKGALFYPCAVMVVAAAIVLVLMGYVVPKFQEVFKDLMNGAPLPPFTLFVLGVSEAVKRHLLLIAVGAVSLFFGLAGTTRTGWGRWGWDRLKLRMPVLGPVFRKLAISRFASTLGTLLGNGVPVLQALAIVKETAGNVIVGHVISTVHDNVKEGGTMAVPLKASGIFPVMVAGMVDVGEQTGALPEMLMKVAENYDDEVDTAVSSMTSLLEPIMIVFLAVVVGGIVIAMFLPIIAAIGGGSGGLTPNSSDVF